MKIKIEEKKPVDVPSEWCTFEGAKFLIAGTSKPAFERKMEIFGAKVGQEFNGIREITDDTAIEMKLEYNKAYSDLILDWDGVIDSDGNPVKYSAIMAEQICTIAFDLLTEQSLSQALVLFIIEQSNRIQNNANKVKIETLGKSQISTNTKPRNGRRRKR